MSVSAQLQRFRLKRILRDHSTIRTSKGIYRYQTIYRCPRCGKESLSIIVNLNINQVTVACHKARKRKGCGLTEQFPHRTRMANGKVKELSKIEAYSAFIDLYYGCHPRQPLQV